MSVFPTGRLLICQRSAFLQGELIERHVRSALIVVPQPARSQNPAPLLGIFPPVHELFARLFFADRATLHPQLEEEAVRLTHVRARR